MTFFSGVWVCEGGGDGWQLSLRITIVIVLYKMFELASMMLDS